MPTGLATLDMVEDSNASSRICVLCWQYMNEKVGIGNMKTASEPGKPNQYAVHREGDRQEYMSTWAMFRNRTSDR